MNKTDMNICAQGFLLAHVFSSLDAIGQNCRALCWTLLFPSWYCLGILVENQFSIKHAYFSTVNSISLICISTLRPICKILIIAVFRKRKKFEQGVWILQCFFFHFSKALISSGSLEFIQILGSACRLLLKYGRGVITGILVEIEKNP